MRSFIFAALLAGALPEKVAAHPYLPLEEGVRATFDYRFKVETTRKEFQQANTDGRVRSVSQGWEERNGKRYLRYETSYEGIPFMKESARLWRSESEEGVFVASEGKNGMLAPTLELPANAEPGVEWKYNDGVESVRKVTQRIEFVLPTGEKLADCLEVSRRITGSPALKDVKDTIVYCRGRGAVRTLFVQPSPAGDYRTETTQRTYEKVTK